MDKAKENDVPCTSQSSSSAAASGQNGSCLSLPEFLNRESKPDLEGLNPTSRTESDLILPALGLQRREEALDLSPTAADTETLSDNTFVTERIDHPEEILDTLKHALVTKLPNITGDLKDLVETHIKQKKLTSQVSQKSEPTDLIKLEKLAHTHNLECELWAKCEIQNLSGSSKFRVASMMLLGLEESGQISSTGTIITHTSATFTLALACANIRLHKEYRFMSVLGDRVSKTKMAILRKMNVKIFRAPEESMDNRSSKESPTMLANFLKQKIPDSVVLDPFQDPWSVQTHFLWTGPEILGQFDDDDGSFDMLVCGYETGGMISGLSYFFKSVTNDKCVVIGSDLSGHLVTKETCADDPDTIYIEEYCSPLLSQVLNVQAVDKWYKILPKDASNMARQTVAKEGIPVSASSGAVLWAAIEAARDFGLAQKKEAKILIILDNFALYTDYDLASNDWLVQRNYLTHPDIESSTWFHQMYCWRIPLKVPVTVFNDFNAAAVATMMQNDGTDRVVVQDAKTNGVIGISCLDSLQRQLRDGGLTSEDLIGSKKSVCTSFKIICINNNLSALLELFKTHTFALLVQRQKFVSARLGRVEQDWIAGILGVQDVVRFIADIEMRHAQKFGMNLCGGFYRAKPPPMKQQQPTIQKIINQEVQLDLKSFKINIGHHLKESIVMRVTTSSSILSNFDQVEEEESAEATGTPPAASMIDFLDPDSEFPADSSHPPSTDSSVPGMAPDNSAAAQNSSPALFTTAAQASSNLETPVSYSSVLDGEQQEPIETSPFTPTRFNSIDIFDDSRTNLSEEISIESVPNNNIYTDSNMDLTESIMSAWYTTEGTDIAAAAAALIPRQEVSSSTLMMDTVDRNSMSEMTSNVLIPIPNIPSNRMYGMPRPNTDCSDFAENEPSTSSTNIQEEKKDTSKNGQEYFGNKKPEPKTKPMPLAPHNPQLHDPIAENNGDVPVTAAGTSILAMAAAPTSSSRHDSIHSVFRLPAGPAESNDSTGSILTQSSSVTSLDLELERRNGSVTNSQAADSIPLVLHGTTTMIAFKISSESSQESQEKASSSNQK